MFSKYRKYASLIVVIILGVWAYLDLSKRQQLPVVKIGTTAPLAKLLDQPILFQPVFLWADSKETRQGTGFLVKAPNGKVSGVTSAHFIDFDGQPLKKAAWVDIRTKKHVIRFTKSYGMPGDGGTSNIFKIDLRSDYLVLSGEMEVPDNLLLQLDERVSPEVGERVFFPNKDSNQAIGFQIVGGQVSEANPGYYIVELDTAVTMQSQSGSPIISQSTGKVIGTLSRSSGKETRTLHLTPSSSILETMKSSVEFPELEKVIGKTK